MLLANFSFQCNSSSHEGILSITAPETNLKFPPNPQNAIVKTNSKPWKIFLDELYVVTSLVPQFPSPPRGGPSVPDKPSKGTVNFRRESNFHRIFRKKSIFEKRLRSYVVRSGINQWSFVNRCVLKQKWVKCGRTFWCNWLRRRNRKRTPTKVGFFKFSATYERIFKRFQDFGVRYSCFVWVCGRISPLFYASSVAGFLQAEFCCAIGIRRLFLFVAGRQPLVLRN